MRKRSLRVLLAELDEHLDGLREEIKGRAIKPGCSECVLALRALADRIEVEL